MNYKKIHNIKLKNISFSYQDDSNELIFSSLNIEFNVNQIISIFGSSGSGKSTLVKILSLILKPNSGDILFNNEEVTNMSCEEQSKLRSNEIGIVPQSFDLFDELSLIENILIRITINENYNQKIHDQAYKIASELEINNLENIKISMLSRGEKQRVAISRSLIGDPSILILDEPSSSLDYSSALNVINIISKYRKEINGITLIFTHDPLFIDFSDKCYQIENRKLTKIK